MAVHLPYSSADIKSVSYRDGAKNNIPWGLYFFLFAPL